MQMNHESSSPSMITSYDRLGELQSMVGSGSNLKLDLPFLSGVENETYSKLLNANLNACGCGSGKALVLISLIGFGFGYFLKLQPIVDHWWLVFPVLVMAAVVGKSVGLLMAKLRIGMIVHQIRQRKLLFY
jgi:hypothetical protein